MKRILAFLPIIHFFILGASSQNINIQGVITNLPSEYVQIFECRLDSLIFIDSVCTDKNGGFKYLKTSPNNENYEAIFKILVRDQHIFFINSPELTVFKTEYKYDYFDNLVTDNLVFVKSKTNSDFLKFQLAMKKLSLAKDIMQPFLQAFPQTDSFHKTVVNEYEARFRYLNSMMDSYKKSRDTSSAMYKILAAYYQPDLGDWKLSLPQRKAAMKKSFFNYFHPADDFYLHTNIIPEKLDQWLSLSLPDKENEPIDEKAMFQAAKLFLDRAKPNDEIFRYCLNLVLHKFYHNRLYVAFVSTYDYYPTLESDECSDASGEFTWAREAATVLKNIEVGKQAPNFQIYQGFSLNDVMSDYTVIVFWASWCSHCQAEVPGFKNRMNKIKSEQLQKSSVTVVAVSLDKDEIEWKGFIAKNNLNSWLNTSELKGWNGEISKKFNIYATPSYVILDKNKSILAFVENADQVEEFFRRK